MNGSVILIQSIFDLAARAENSVVSPGRSSQEFKSLRRKPGADSRGRQIAHRFQNRKAGPLMSIDIPAISMKGELGSSLPGQYYSRTLYSSTYNRGRKACLVLQLKSHSASLTS